MYRRSGMCRGTAPSLILCLVLLYSLYVTAEVLVNVDQTHPYIDQRGVVQEKQAYLQRMKELYGTLAEHYDSGMDSNKFIRRLTILGVVSDLLSDKDSSVKTVMSYVRGNRVLQESSDGSFKTILTTDAPFEGERCFLVEGSVDYEALAGKVRKVSPVSCSEHPATWSTLMFSEPIVVDGDGSNIPEYNNGSKGINELMDLANKAECRIIKGECARGTVVMDPWLNKTLTFQRRLGQNISLDQQQILGTHNSFNDKADGYGSVDSPVNEILKILSGGHWEFVWAQQYFSMTDQLNLGSRYLMLDPVYFWGAMRLCHCGTTFKWVDKVIDFIEKALNKTFQFDSGDLGCMPNDRKFEDGVKEIHDWVTAPGHENEVVMIMINDFTKDHDWGHINLIHNPIREVLGEMIFTPNDKEKYFPSKWPTSQQLIDLGKRVIVLGTDRCANASLIFKDMTVPVWDLDSMKYFTPYPKCGGYKQPGQWYIVGGESQLVGPIYNGPEEEGLITAENMPYLLQCPVSILKIDLVSPGLLEGGAWSWAKGYSVDNVTTSQCVAMNLSENGRWVTLPCSTPLPYACQNGTDVVLSTTTGPWNNKTNCPNGFTFYLPRTGYESWKLYQYSLSELGSLQAKFIWLNLPGSLL